MGACVKVIGGTLVFFIITPPTIQYSGPRGVATCIAGQARTFCSTFVNIYGMMIQPIINETDVFLSTTNFSCHEQVEQLIKPVSVHLRLRARGYGKSNYWFPCWNDILYQETKRERRYAWSLRIRTDIVYTSPIVLPVYSRMPAMYVECCGTCGNIAKVHFEQNIRYGQQCPTKLNGKWGCAKDTWNLLTREAAEVFYTEKYYNRSECYAMHAECRFGCKMLSNNVSVIKHSPPFDRKIIRVPKM